MNKIYDYYYYLILLKQASPISINLQATFKKAGIEVTRENRKEIDRIIQGIVGSNYTDCPAIWRQV